MESAARKMKRVNFCAGAASPPKRRRPGDCTHRVAENIQVDATDVVDPRQVIVIEDDETEETAPTFAPLKCLPQASMEHDVVEKVTSLCSKFNV